jgi:hypothetical protein
MSLEERIQELSRTIASHAGHVALLSNALHNLELVLRKHLNRTLGCRQVEINAK